MDIKPQEKFAKETKKKLDSNIYNTDNIETYSENILNNQTLNICNNNKSTIKDCTNLYKIMHYYELILSVLDDKVPLDDIDLTILSFSIASVCYILFTTGLIVYANRVSMCVFVDILYLLTLLVLHVICIVIIVSNKKCNINMIVVSYFTCLMFSNILMKSLYILYSLLTLKIDEINIRNTKYKIIKNVFTKKRKSLNPRLYYNIRHAENVIDVFNNKRINIIDATDIVYCKRLISVKSLLILIATMLVGSIQLITSFYTIWSEWSFHQIVYSSASQNFMYTCYPYQSYYIDIIKSQWYIYCIIVFIIILNLIVNMKYKKQENFLDYSKRSVHLPFNSGVIMIYMVLYIIYFAFQGIFVIVMPHVILHRLTMFNAFFIASIGICLVHQRNYYTYVMNFQKSKLNDTNFTFKSYKLSKFKERANVNRYELSSYRNFNYSSKDPSTSLPVLKKRLYSNIIDKDVNKITRLPSKNKVLKRYHHLIMVNSGVSKTIILNILVYTREKTEKSLQVANFQYERYKDDEGIENDLSDIDYVKLPNKLKAQDIGRVALMKNTSVRKAVIIVAKGNPNCRVPTHVGVYKSQLRDILKVKMTMKEKLLSYDGTFCIHFDGKRTKSYIEGIKTAERVSNCLQGMSKFL
ncbi:hypothetical protein A3Q56_07781 [Intoshia linei]|uniref:Uncharacterized protein n=1 Tax=Intoshia linei TaxID=1819745 RepID=A0A177AT14_9BILA|nr:hypothetical protein A3Q56_07781 [Intoshia linei]